jgi:hypothetical protein
MLAVVGKGCKLQPPEPRRDVISVVAVDRSGSTAAMRETLLMGLHQIYQEAAISGRSLAIWAADAKPVLLWGPRIPEEEYLPEGVKKGLDPSQQPVIRGTRPGLLWAELADRHASSTVPIQIDYLTDGGNDAPGDLSRLREAVQRLSHNPQVSVAILGVLPEHKTWLEKEFRPAFGDRLSIGGPEEILDEVRRRTRG